MELWIGIDGTDSPYGGCTTWTMSNIIDRLMTVDSNLEFLDYPNLIRLDPNIPYKTRGNGALSLHIRTNLSIDYLSDLIVGQILADQSHYRLNPDKQPGLLICQEKPPVHIYQQALQHLLTVADIRSDFEPLFVWPDWNTSHIGAAAAIAADLTDDFTFELLAYRFLDNCRTPREINPRRLQELSLQYPSVFSSYDDRQHRELICPAGPDPIFCGIRGESVDDLKIFFKELRITEELHSYTIFRTNQATDAHVSQANRSNIPYDVYSGDILVTQIPDEIQGGHVFSKGYDGQQYLGLNWFEPTKKLRDRARNLLPGDRIYIDGAVIDDDHVRSVNVEYMMIISAPDRIIRSPPICECGQRMTSAGTFAGYKCKSCGHRSKFSELEIRHRALFTGQMVFSSKSAQRHLTRPLERLHRKNTSIPNQILFHHFRTIYHQSYIKQ